MNKYTIKPNNKGWQVVRPDKSIVNGVTFASYEDAVSKLNLLVAFGYCVK